MIGRRGQVGEVADGKAKDARGSNVHWLTPRTFRLWVDVGLRGHGADGLPSPGWLGRLEDRNVRATELDERAGHVPVPLSERLQGKAARLRDLADTHHRTRIRLQDGTA
ncbi:hypothetical protein [Streptomyces sp. NPDC005262]|uniref:hypothetical protein n=1 Tax=Streptomyces sp. NPDC005262 TaxID=3364710 RepID=UPI0036BE1627